MEELWKVIPRYSNYEVSNNGKVRRYTPGKGTFAGRDLKLGLNSDGYPCVWLCSDIGKRSKLLVHYLVTLTFLGERPEGYAVNHIDANKCNNEVTNLEYITVGDNVRHAFRLNLMNIPKGEDRYGNKLSSQDVIEIRELLANGVPQNHIAKIYKVSKGTIFYIKHRKKWKHIG